MEAVKAAAHAFRDRLTIMENRVEKDAGYFNRPETPLRRTAMAGDDIPRCQDRRGLPMILSASLTCSMKYPDLATGVPRPKSLE
jgi:hypothetical protein